MTLFKIPFPTISLSPTSVLTLSLPFLFPPSFLNLTSYVNKSDEIRNTDIVQNTALASDKCEKQSNWRMVFRGKREGALRYNSATFSKKSSPYRWIITTPSHWSKIKAQLSIHVFHQKTPRKKNVVRFFSIWSFLAHIPNSTLFFSNFCL